MPAYPAGPVLRAAELRQWQDAATMLDDAQREAEALRQAAALAAEAERHRGYAEGQAQAASEAAQLLLALEQAASDAMIAMEAALPDLVCDLVEGVIGERPAQQTLGLAVRHALGRLRRGAAASLRVAPDGHRALREALDGHPAANGLRLETDIALAPGRCLFESEFGVVELGIEAQLRVLRETMAARWEQAA